MTDLFESYASDFAQLVQSVEERLVADFSKLSASARRSAIQNAEAEAEEAHDLLVQMEIEVQSFPQSVRERYSGNLRDLKGQHEQLRRKLVRFSAHEEIAPAAARWQRPPDGQLYRRRRGGQWGLGSLATPTSLARHVVAGAGQRASSRFDAPRARDRGYWRKHSPGSAWAARADRAQS